LTLGWAIVAVIVLTAFLAVTRLLRRLLWTFVLTSIALLALHYQSNPAEAATAGAALGGTLLAAGPLRALLLRFFL
jgi:hypothetical protein